MHISPRGPKLLVYYVYSRAVGHVIEGLRYALGYHIANPSWEISLVMNKYSPWELAKLCPWIKNIYTVGIRGEKVRVPEKIHRHIPRRWDYMSVILDYKKNEPPWTAYYRCHEQMEAYFNNSFVAKKAYWKDDIIPYSRNQQLKLVIPKVNISWARKKLKNTDIKIGILPAGCNKKEYFPSVRSWDAIVNALFKKYGSGLSIYFFGAFKKVGHRSISIIHKKGILRLIKKYKNCVNCIDVGLLNQLAVLEKCDVIISTESGFAYAALTVGTPFLEISGGPWPNYFHNGVPFYSVLPDIDKYPPLFMDRSKEKTINENGEEKILSMSYRRIIEDIPEILKGVDILINGKWVFPKHLKYYYGRLKKYYRDTKEMIFFDQTNKKYLYRKTKV